MPTVKTIHIVNVTTGNGGDLLMAMAAAHALVRRLGPRRILLDGRRVPDVNGLRVTSLLLPKPLRWASRLRRKLDRMNAIRSMRHGELVLDANGYRHGHIWPAGHIESDLELAAAVRERGAHLVLLPKSYGPFDAATGARFAQLVAATDLAWARDEESLRLSKPYTDRLRLCPDFTVGVRTHKPAGDETRRGILLVPNSKLVERGFIADFDAYARFLSDCSVRLATPEHGCRVLFHQDKDYRRLHRRLTRLGIPWMFDKNPLACKAELAKAWLVLSSRYHGMIGALSSGTPCLVLGWAHKYGGFLDFYPGGRDLLVPEASVAAVAERAAWINSPGTREQVTDRLAQGNSSVAAQAEAMWDEVAGLESV
jgi:colanic acid/amylovoran biosynthesis protein